MQHKRSAPTLTRFIGLAEISQGSHTRIHTCERISRFLTNLFVNKLGLADGRSLKPGEISHLLAATALMMG